MAIKNSSAVNHSLVPSHKLVWLGVFFGMGFYIADALIDAFVFNEGLLLDQLLRPGHHEIWMRLSVLAVAVAFGTYAHILFRREQATAEQAQTAEKFLNSVIDNLPDMVFIKDARELRFVRVNQTGEKLLGLTTRELIGKNDYDFFPQAQADFFIRKDREVLETGTVVDIAEEEISTKHHGKRMLHTRKIPILDDDGHPAFLLGIAEDITEKKKTGEEIARFGEILEESLNEIYIFDAQTLRFLQANKGARNNLGYTAEEIQQLTPLDLKPEFNNESFAALIEPLRSGAKQRLEFTTTHQRKNGTRYPVEVHLQLLQTDIQPVFVAMILDITEKQRTAAALVDSERRFRSVFNSTYQFIGLMDPDGIILEANQSILEFLGYTEQDLIGKPFWEGMWRGVPPEEQSRIKDAIKEARQGNLVRYQVDMVGKNYTIRTIDFSLKPVLNEQGKTVLIIPEGRDITELRQAEDDAKHHLQELAHVLRLSSMGEMASGMAHELNQPLTALVSYCGTASALVSEIPSPPPQLINVLERANEQAHRAGNIIKHLRELVSKETANKEPVDLDQLICDVVMLLKGDVQNSETKVELHLDGRRRKVMADRIQIEQVLINLVRNSMEAIEQADKTAGLVVIQSRVLANNAIEVTVTDNGTGIDATMLDVVFDPFQTNKATGMGIGLSISRTIIETHGGKLWVDKEPRTGARFGFELPVS